jgi:hypothetical protein
MPDVPGRSPPAWRCSTFVSAILLAAGCAARPPVPAVAPSAASWVVYNQSYNLASASSSTSTYSTGTSQVTVTQSSYDSRNTVNEGSPTSSAEPPLCGGFGWVRDCPAFNGSGGDTP